MPFKAVSEKGRGKVVIPKACGSQALSYCRTMSPACRKRTPLCVFSGDADLYPLVRTSFEGLDMLRCQSPISAMNAENIAITGYGVLDGSGDSWRPVLKKAN